MPSKKTVLTRTKNLPSSMTGFAQRSGQFGDVTVTVEIRSVNHRFLDLALRLPKVYSSLEMDLRAVVSESIKRGRLDISVTRTEIARADTGKIDHEYISSAVKAYSEISKQFGVGTDAIGDLIARLVVSSISGQDNGSRSANEGETDFLRDLFEGVLSQLVAMRRVEGEALGGHIAESIEQLRKIHEKIEKLADGAPQKVKKRLEGRIKLIAPEIKLDKVRLAAEVAFIADRIDIVEEIKRLVSHFSQLESALKQTQAGKRLDFLIQECGREFNTIGSKCQDAKIQQHVVEAKLVLERMREQVQNIE